MVFSDDSTIRLSENTKLEIKEFLFKDKSRTGLLFTAHRQNAADVKKYIGGDNVFEVQSPTAVAGVRGTGFEFDEAVTPEKMGKATVACTEGSLNLSALSATGEVVSTAVLEAGQVAVIIGGVITISAIGEQRRRRVSPVHRKPERQALRVEQAPVRVATATAGGGATTATTTGSGTTVAAGGAATTDSDSCDCGNGNCGNGPVNDCHRWDCDWHGCGCGWCSCGGGGGGSSNSSSGSTPCSASDGIWTGTYSGTICNISDNGTFITNCSNCICTTTLTNLNRGGGSATGTCTISGNSISCIVNVLDCGGNLCPRIGSGTISGNSVSGSINSCGANQTFTGAKQ